MAFLVCRRTELPGGASSISRCMPCPLPKDLKHCENHGGGIRVALQGSAYLPWSVACTRAPVETPRHEAGSCYGLIFVCLWHPSGSTSTLKEIATRPLRQSTSSTCSL